MNIKTIINERRSLKARMILGIIVALSLTLGLLIIFRHDTSALIQDSFMWNETVQLMVE